MCAASVNTVQADKQEDKQAEQGRKMATNMDEEQSLRECEAYVQMHGSFSIPTISRYPRSFPTKLFRNQIFGFNVTISTKISL